MATRAKTPPTRGKYQWAEWADGEWWDAYRVTPARPDGDYVCDSKHFRTLAYRWAFRNEMKVNTQVFEDMVKFKFHPMTEEEKAHARAVQAEKAARDAAKRAAKQAKKKATAPA